MNFHYEHIHFGISCKTPNASALYDSAGLGAIPVDIPASSTVLFGNAVAILKYYAEIKTLHAAIMEL